MNPKLNELPPYLFVEIEKQKKELKRKGVRFYDFSIGDPDLPPPSKLLSLLKEELDKKIHNYSSTRGESELRESFVQWYRTRYGVSIDPETEICLCVGTKDGIFHLPTAICNEGDTVLVPDPCYNVYPSATIMARCKPVYMPLVESNDFLPDLDDVSGDVARQARLIYVNYPNNPISAQANMNFYKELVEWARENDVIIAQDAAYQDLVYDSKPISLLQVDGAKEIAIEFYSFSKIFSITGWRVGFAIGNRDVISSLHKLKSNADSGQFIALQNAIARFLPLSQPFINELNSVYKKRREIFCGFLDKAGYKYLSSLASFFVWWKIPEGETSAGFSNRILEEKRILVLPGNGFGQSGEGYVRASLTCPDSDIVHAMEGL